MTKQETFSHPPRDPQLEKIIKLAILAVGGQGGGVLTNWIEQLARANGYVAQATSVAGVAQRTGTTVYYVEMAPDSAEAPVFSLAPSPGDVDVVIAAEMMEAGRAIMRGFVTPDKTALIASTHRALAVSEKIVPGDGIVQSDEVQSAAEIASRQLVMLDLEALAVANGSVISASLFGALAASGALPFPCDAFEDAIRASGRGVESSLCAFAAAFESVNDRTETPPAPVEPAEKAMSGPPDLMAAWENLRSRVKGFPEPVQDIAMAGLRKTVDFQDIAYGTVYLDRLSEMIGLDRADRSCLLSREAAKYIANAMAYDDVIQVADLKTRSGRMARIRGEMAADARNLVHVTEFFHPRAEEIAGLMPVRLGRWFEASPSRMGFLDRWFGKGRRLRSDRLPAFLALYALAGLRGLRLRNLRHSHEVANLTHWLDTVRRHVEHHYDLSVELLRNRRLIKGYSDTHARGQSKFDRVMAAATDLAGREDGADWMRRLREAALLDEEGVALDGALRTIASFTGSKTE
ncbi:MAG: indolepyruvate oxidoreductase subunit beta family protein [Roseovarius sp.]